MGAALRILLDVVGYRLRRLEMANLAGAVAIMVVLKLPWSDVLLRTAFGAMLNIFVYLNNDYRDIALDERSPDRDRTTVSYLQMHMREAYWVQWALVMVMIAIGVLHSAGLLLALAVGGGICWAYSKTFKRMPYVDVLSMTVWGVAMPMCGFPLDQTLGWVLALQLGLFSSVFEPIQVIRDREVDAQLGLRTTAVVMGVGPTLALARILTAAAAAYAALLLHPIAGGMIALGLFVPWGAGHASRFWTAIKLIFGCAWLFACASTYLGDGSSGLWVQVALDDTFSTPGGLR